MLTNHTSFIIKAPAKINWFLIVKGLRNDGYHEIISLMQKISLYDELIFEPSEDIEIITDANIPLKENLIYKAINALRILRDNTHLNSHCIRITLKKEIPMSAGLGGGSSDAAATIVGLNQLWGLGLSIEDMMKIGATIGSDVPFFFGPPSAIVSGKGEVIHPVRLGRSYPLLLVKPPVSVETAWAYSEIDRAGWDNNPDEGDQYPSSFVRFLERGHTITPVERNDLEKVVINKYPEIGEIKDTLKSLGAIFSIMTGSGPTVIGLFDTHKRAEEVMKVIPGHYWSKIADTII